MGMFDFLLMADNYEQRKVARFDADWGFISTAYVNDAARPYETAVEHRQYNDGKMVIVAAYDTKEEAQAGHNHWVRVMTADTLPDRLVDRGEAELAELVDVFRGDNEWRIKERSSSEKES